MLFFGQLLCSQISKQQGPGLAALYFRLLADYGCNGSIHDRISGGNRALFSGCLFKSIAFGIIASHVRNSPVIHNICVEGHYGDAFFIELINALIKQLYNLGVEREENSELMFPPMQVSPNINQE